MLETALIKYLVDHCGYVGAILAALILAFGYWHRCRLAELKTQVDEHKADKADYRQLITGNTEAITKMAGALENNTSATKETMTSLRELRSCMERMKQ